MYEILVETTLEDLLIILIKDKKMFDFFCQKKLLKKSEILPVEFEKLLKKNNVDIKDINNFYVTTGPGSLTGQRVGFIFVKTLAQVLKKNLFIANTCQFISQNQDGLYYVDASKSQSYQCQINKTLVKVDLIDRKPKTILNYQKIINEIDQYLNIFEKVDDLVDFKLTYYKNM